MMQHKILPGLLIIGIITALLPSCQKFTEPEYLGVDNLQVKSQGRSDTYLSADVIFYNPNRRNINFKSGDLDIYVENKKLGHTELDSLITVPRLDTFLIPVSIKIDMQNLIANALTLAMKDSVLVRLEGKVRVGRSGLFVTKPVRYETKEKLDLLKGLW